MGHFAKRLANVPQARMYVTAMPVVSTVQGVSAVAAIKVTQEMVPIVVILMNALHS